MAKEAGDKKSVAPLTLPQEPIEGRENLDKIRELLFGPQVRTFNQRFSRLEDRLVREMGDLRDEVRKRV
ncbi:MAG: hypothetical protein FJY85_10670, partial [Deltaproteobacteria bacterium]|nr:hypothetical protein [Deltaproteobacteria bacterium]